MEIIDNLNLIQGYTAVALGNFDSVHKGHKSIISRCSYIAKRSGLKSAVLCFKELPQNVIEGSDSVKNVLSFEEKAAEIEKFGIDYLICIDFDESIMSMEPEDFAETVLAGKLHAKEVVCGFNYSFGHFGSGNSDDLKAFGRKYGFNTNVIEEYTVNGNTVSSSEIRLFLRNGNLKSYEDYTGRKYHIYGIVEKGQHLGTELGFPTANIYPDDNLQLPKSGVYFTQVRTGEDKIYKGLTYVGCKPTVGSFGPVIETFILDFNEDLYGNRIEISFLEFIRDEYRFDSIESLKNQIEKDCQNALQRS